MIKLEQLKCSDAFHFNFLTIEKKIHKKKSVLMKWSFFLTGAKEKMLIQHLKKVEKDVLSTNSSLHMELICILISSSGNIAFKNTAYIKVNSKTKKRTIEH